MFQEPRTQEQQATFEKALRDMDLWYTNRNFHVWLMTEVPRDALSNRPYQERGWTTWEHAVGSMITNNFDNGFKRYPIDVSKFQISRGSSHPDYEDIRQQCMDLTRPIPLTPDQFRLVIQNKTFTKGSQDSNIVVSNYERSFSQVMSVITEFKFEAEQIVTAAEAKRGLGVEKAKMLSDLLPWTPKLQQITLSKNKIGNDGAVALFSKLGMLSSQHFFYSQPFECVIVQDCGIEDAGAEALAVAIENGLCMSYLFFCSEGNPTCEEALVRLRGLCKIRSIAFC